MLGEMIQLRQEQNRAVVKSTDSGLMDLDKDLDLSPTSIIYEPCDLGM